VRVLYSTLILLSIYYIDNNPTCAKVFIINKVTDEHESSAQKGNRLSEATTTSTAAPNIWRHGKYVLCSVRYIVIVKLLVLRLNMHYYTRSIYEIILLTSVLNLVTLLPRYYATLHIRDSRCTTLYICYIYKRRSRCKLFREPQILISDLCYYSYVIKSR
jgi:hypothetical protein